MGPLPAWYVGELHTCLAPMAVTEGRGTGAIDGYKLLFGC